MQVAPVRSPGERDVISLLKDWDLGPALAGGNRSDGPPQV